MMKTGTKKVLYTFIAVVSALGLGIGAVLVSMLNVQASTEMMPGIEQILDEKSEKTPFRILELVNSSSVPRSAIIFPVRSRILPSIHIPRILPMEVPGRVRHFLL